MCRKSFLDASKMPVQRSRQPPALSRTVKASLDSTLHPSIDASLKDLKTCARRLQPILATFSDELQILHRLYYKGKNQHRPALFWRRVAEMRRHGDRVEELSLVSLVDSLRYSFFGEDLQQTSKLLKCSWTHYPDSSSVLFMSERIAGALTLVQQMRERLVRAYQSFTLAMQTGAFIQLIMPLGGIASRMASLVSELADVLELIWGAVHRILLTLDPGSRAPNLPRRRRTSLPDRSSPMETAAQISADIFEDTGVSIPRQDPQEDARPDIYSYTIPHDNAPRTPISVDTLERNVIVKKVKAVNEPAQRKPKKKRARDEIDDIFG
ncbi:hypothetical protein B0H17DRAFT_246790 [Mycena rosella]|uniref:Nucleolus and neural progenitor protein-like N-terminal domain-containing protein n=1 Tax=Mycena rosella TaxID=1033263 RepID=A0AAD7H1V9_MYCRO|nr:hypothetical protein B0H17DRAFT_246790 [Mycena rosella]